MAGEKVTVEWKINDGYVCNGTHTFHFDKKEWDELNDDEKDNYVNECAMDQITITWKEKK